MNKLQHQCKFYDDKCFTRVINETVTRGCLFELVESSSTNDCVDTNVCDICGNQSMCNSEPIKVEYCYSCDSRDDESCRSVVTTSMRKKCPLFLHPVGCYHIERMGNNDTIVERGCFVHYDQTFCRANSDWCKTCIGTDCNSKSSYLRCLSCESGSFDNCFYRPNEVSTELCRNYNDRCLIQTQNGLVRRGCVDEHYKCIDNYDCHLCSNSSMCNNIPLPIEYCIRCNSNENPLCHPLQNMSQKQCNPSIYLHGCYHIFSAFHGYTERGCLSDLISIDRETCRKGNGLCRACLGDGCNNRNTFQHCYECTSMTDKFCIFRPNLSMSSCPHYNDQCFIYASNGNIERGCLKKKDDEFISTCLNDRENCMLCQDETLFCNNQLPVVDICIQCDSRNHINCINATWMDMMEYGGNCRLTLSSQGCFLEESETLTGDTYYVRRGCISNMGSKKEQRKCIENSKKCHICHTAGCNIQPKYQECYICENCPTVQAHQKKTCITFFDSCVIVINGTGHTNRGCVNSYDSTKLKKSKHTICHHHSCNSLRYPIYRMSCYHCNGDDMCQYNNQQLFNQTLKTCELYSSDQICYSCLSKGEFHLILEKKNISVFLSFRSQTLSWLYI